MKAGLAFCHISIPSIESVSDRLHLLLQCAIVALQNNCLPQTDTFLKAAISLVPEMPLTEEVDYKKFSTEPKLASLLCSFLGLLVVVPGSPEHGPFYLVQGFLNAVPRFGWNESGGAEVGVYIEMLGLLGAFAQRSLPYHVDGVDSNDTLYGGSKEYCEELDELVESVMKLIVEKLTKLGELGEGGCHKIFTWDMLKLLHKTCQNLHIRYAKIFTSDMLESEHNIDMG